MRATLGIEAIGIGVGGIDALNGGGVRGTRELPGLLLREARRAFRARRRLQLRVNMI